MATFVEDGLRFSYPETWQLTREDNPSGWTVSLQSPGTAFLLITLDRDMPDTDAMIDTALDAMKEEYEGLEFEPVVDTIAGQPAVGHDMHFFSFDLTNTCGTRSFVAETGTVLLFWQLTDLEADEINQVIRAICASMKIEEE